MPDEQDGGSAKTTPRLIGIAVSVILVVLLAVFAGMRLRPRKLLTTTYFTNSAGLKAGAAVNLNGVTIGTVKTVTITPAPERRKTPVQVVMELDPSRSSNLHTDSKAMITSLGALGDTSIDITGRDAVGPPLRDGDELRSVASPTVLDAQDIQATLNTANAVVGRLNTVVDQIETGKGSIGQLMSNPGLTNQATATIGKVRELSTKLSGTGSTAGKLINNPSLSDKFGKIATDMQGVNVSLTKLTSGPLQANLTETQTHVNSLTANMNAGKGAVGMLMTDSPIKKDLSGAMGQANTLTAGIGAGKGTAGKLVAGGDVNVNLAKLQSESSALATMIRQNPTKYLTIKVRIF